jgi:hypothetical protein
MSKVNYVCATCGQDFTRRYSANRHNNHFHFGNGIIVRLLEYIIGRTNGRFPPPLLANNNNLSTRIIRKWWYNNNDSSNLFTGRNNYNNNNGLRGGGGGAYDGEFTTVPDQTGNALGCGTVGQPVKNNNNINLSKDISKTAPPYYINPSLQSPSGLSDETPHTKQSEPLEEFQERISIFAEIKTLLTPYFPHQDICNMLQLLAAGSIRAGNNNFLSEILKMVRQTVKFRQDLDQLSSPDLPLSVNNNNNMAATDRATSLIGNNRFIAQNNYQNYTPPFTSPPPLQLPQQQGHNFHPIFFYTLFRPPRSIDEISNIMHNISPKP